MLVQASLLTVVQAGAMVALVAQKWPPKFDAKKYKK